MLRIRLFALFGFILATFGMVLTASPARACDFEEPPPPQEALNAATAVFSGEVIEIEPVEDDPSGQYLAVTFEVDRVWKGVESSPVTVETHQDEGVCGYPFVVGESYLVYAHSNRSPLTTALYHRTTHIDQAEEDLDVLGSGTEITATGTDSEDGAMEEFNVGILVLVVVIVSMIVATIMLLRQSKPGLPDDYDDHDAGDDDPAIRRD
jgi:hypothetical protein